MRFSFFSSYAPAAIEPIHEVRIEGAAVELELETRAAAPYRQETVRRDVEKLWELGRFSDVQVRRESTPVGPDIVFQVKPRPRYALREVVFEPASEERSLNGEPPDWVDEATARELAGDLALALRSKGFLDAKVRGSLAPVDAARADLVFSVEPGKKLRVSKVEIGGVDSEQARTLRRSVSELKRLTIIPGLFSLSRAFTPQRLGQDLRSLRSELASQGRLAAVIETRMEPSEKGDRVAVKLVVTPGPRFLTDGEESFPAERLCGDLRAARRESESAGRLGFKASVEALRQGAVSDSGAQLVNLRATTEAGPPETVRRIDFFGEASLSYTTLRRALKLEEGDLLDSNVLRRDLARLSSFEALEPVTMQAVDFTQSGDGLVDLAIHVKGKKSRRWSISGPLGPASLFGPFQGMLETRLPAWGRGLLEASTYTAGFWLAGLPQVLATADGWSWKTVYTPLFVVRRTALPGQAWTSGFFWSPQLGSTANIASNAMYRGRGLLSRIVTHDDREPPLTVPITGEGVNSELVCRDRRSWADAALGMARFLTGI